MDLPFLQELPRERPEHALRGQPEPGVARGSRALAAREQHRVQPRKVVVAPRHLREGRGVSD